MYDAAKEDEELDGEELNTDEEGGEGDKDEDDIPRIGELDANLEEEPLALEDVKSTEQRPLPKTTEEIVPFISAFVNVDNDAVDEALDYERLAELARGHPLLPEFCRRVAAAGAGPEWAFCHPDGDPLEDLRDFVLWIQEPASTSLGPPPTVTTTMACDDATNKAR